MISVIAAALGIHLIDPAARQGESFSFTTPCTISVQGCEICSLIFPVKAAHWNLHEGQGQNGLGVDTLSFISMAAESASLLIPDESGLFFEAGTFYITAESIQAGDTILTQEPPHLIMNSTVQISLRPDDSYTGYLHELLGTPFIMAPRVTPGGVNQSDSRLGTDCAGLAVYGRRRMGDTAAWYLGPGGILPFLEPLSSCDYYSREGIYISLEGDTAAVPEAGDILHFRSQVSIFLEDRGIPGVLDENDMIIQSWYDGTDICRIEESGFTEYPLRLYRWKEPEALE